MPVQVGGGSNPTASGTTDERTSSASEPGRTSGENSPMMMSPWNQSSAFVPPSFAAFGEGVPQNALVGSLVREEGHIYSLAVTGGVLYTGSESKNIRVWKSLKEFSGFKANSGLVKAIVLSNGKIFTGHQDGKIRVWKVSPKNPAIHRRSGTLPTLKDIFKSSINPSNYKEVRRRRTLWIKHSDAVSSLSLNDAVGLLYSASWDRTVKVWRLSDSKCLESLSAHEDAVNSVIGHVEDMVFTASADGTVKMWRREVVGSRTKHYHDQTLLMQESSVTALAVNGDGSFLYCGSSDGVVNYWERDEDQLTHGGVVKGHKLAVLCLATAGSVLFSGSADKTICVWRREGGAHTCLSVLTGHTGPVKCLTVEIDPESQNNNNGDNDRWIVYSGSLDKSVKVWSVSGRAVNVNNLLAFGTTEVGGGLGQNTS